MGWLVPEFVKSVTLKLTPDEAKREAIGRIASVTGAGVGLLGGLMVLRANPAARAIFAGRDEITLKMTAQQARQDAVGKVLALSGTAVGVVGSVLVAVSNPKIRAMIPPAVRANAGPLALVGLTALGLGTAWLIKSQKKALLERYE